MTNEQEAEMGVKKEARPEGTIRGELAILEESIDMLGVITTEFMGALEQVLTPIDPEGVCDTDIREDKPVCDVSRYIRFINTKAERIYSELKSHHGRLEV